MSEQNSVRKLATTDGREDRGAMSKGALTTLHSGLKDGR